MARAFAKLLWQGVGGILFPHTEHAHAYEHERAPLLPPHLHRTHVQGGSLSCAGGGWRCHAHGDLTFCCRGDTNQREKPPSLAHMRLSVRSRLWQKPELEEGDGEEEEELEEEGLQEFTLCLACLRFMPYSLAPFYKGEDWTGLFNYQANKLDMTLSWKLQVSALTGSFFLHKKGRGCIRKRISM